MTLGGIEGDSRISVVLIHRAGWEGGQHGMAKPYSMDRRERAVAAVVKEGLSRHASAARFGIAPSTVINWVRRFRETGSVAPGQMGGRKPKAIAGEHAVFLARRVRDGAFTLL